MIDVLDPEMDEIIRGFSVLKLEGDLGLRFLWLQSGASRQPIITGGALEPLTGYNLNNLIT